MVRHNINLPTEQIAEFCRRHHIRKLSLFGSILRDDFGPDSDVDVLVDFEPGKTPGFEFFGLSDELSDIIGRRADVNTVECLSKYFVDEVLREAEIVYVAA